MGHVKRSEALELYSRWLKSHPQVYAGRFGTCTCMTFIRNAAHSTTIVFPTGSTQNRSDSMLSFFRAKARSTGGLLSGAISDD